MRYMTFLTSGCIDICKNMLFSAKKVGINHSDFYIFCLDDKSYDELSDFNNCIRWKSSELDNTSNSYKNYSWTGKSDFRKVTKNKWKIISELYNTYNDICWVDNDVVFRENPINHIKNNDKILFQSDLPGSKLCTGFMVFNDTQHCQRFIKDCSTKIPPHLWDQFNEQSIINEIALVKYFDHISILDKNLFPNGHFYYKENIKERAVIVHNNWMIGIENKINSFKSENLWFI